MLELKHITKVYEAGTTQVEALKGIDIAFRENEFVAILGQSGCGKTTLLKIIGGAFVVVVGLYIFFQNPVVQIRRNRSGKVSLWRDFLSIFLFTIANPAISLVFVGLFAMFGISNDAGYINGVAMLVGVLAGAAGWWFLFTFVLNIYRKRFRPRYLLWMNRIAGILIILLGVTAIISSLFNIHFDELIPK